mmetsp:Transcript_3036/g.10970  ORF Transcript_3036/g.10970 Transcript_3036/m.10970 type:complete len:215 (+) Transcript_3036:362-1006(+)
MTSTASTSPLSPTLTSSAMPHPGTDENHARNSSLISSLGARISVRIFRNIENPRSYASAALYARNIAINSNSVGSNPSARKSPSTASIPSKSPLAAHACIAGAYVRTFVTNRAALTLAMTSSAPFTSPFAAFTRTIAVYVISLFSMSCFVMYSTISSARSPRTHSTGANPVVHAPVPPAHRCSNTLHECALNTTVDPGAAASPNASMAASNSSR